MCCRDNLVIEWQHVAPKARLNNLAQIAIGLGEVGLAFFQNAGKTT
jgi:hypothetical protein